MKKLSLTSIFLVFTLLVSSQNRDKSSLEKSKISFTENKGQICDQFLKQRNDVIFSGSNNGLNYHIKINGISYQLNKIKSTREVNLGKDEGIKTTAEAIDFYRIDFSYLGCNNKPIINVGESISGVTNYYLPQCPSGVLNVKSYKDFTLKELYNGIDLKWYGNNEELEYDFIVAPYVDYRQIKMKIEGASKIEINSKGELEISTPFGIIIEKAPVAYQDNRALVTKWELNNKNVVSFKVQGRNISKILRIDPVVRKWGSYYGSINDEFGRDCKPDGLGNIYLTGYTGSPTSTNIATLGSHQTTFNGGTYDAFLVKFDNAGVRQWGTFYGGNALDYGFSIALNSNAVYMAGYSMSTGTDVATPSSHQSVNGGNNDGLIVKFDVNGVRQWATLYGGSGDDRIYSCALNSVGDIYVSGQTGTSTSTIIATPGSHQPNYAGNDDAFLAKFSSSGVRLWGTYYGGADGDNSFACAVDAGGNVYITGRTQTQTGTVIATPGSHQPSFSGALGSFEAFLVKFNSSGVRQFGTYYGSTSDESGNGVATDLSNNVYMVGQTTSPTSTAIATGAAHQTTIGGGTADAFAVKFNSTGARQWGTYLGGTNDDQATGCSIDFYGNLLMCGFSNSANGIASVGAYQATNPGVYTGFLEDFNPTNGARLWGTFYGGPSNDYARSCSGSTSGHIYLAGFSSSTSSISSVGSHQSTLNGISDAFLAQLTDCPSNTMAVVSSTNNICSGQSVTLTATGSGFSSYLWNTSATSSVIVVSPSLTSVYTVTANPGGGSACNVTNSVIITASITPTVVVTPTSALVCSGNSATLIATGASTYSWSTGALTNSIVVTPTALAQPIVTGYNGTCSHSLMTNVGVSTTPTINITGAPSATYCSGGALTMTASGALNYTWSNGPTTTTNLVTPTVVTIYTVTGALGPCISTNTISVNVITTPTVNLNSSVSSICLGGSATLTASGATSYSWNTSATTSAVVVSPTVNTTYTVTGFNGACVNTKTIALTMTTNIAMTASANPSILCSMTQLTLTSSGATNYTWSTSALTSTDVVSPISSDSYTVYGTNGACTGSAVVNVTVNPLPNVSASASSSLICLSGTVALTAGGAQNYTWMPGSLVGAVQTETPNITTVYSVTGIDAQLCSKTQTVLVTVDPCTGIKENDGSSATISIYPNPNNGNFVLRGSNGIYHIVNALGQIVSTIELSNNQTSVTLSNYSSGVYFIIGNNITQKFIVLE